MQKKAHYSGSSISLAAFSVLFITSLILYLSWRGIYISVYLNNHEKIAAIYLLPFCCIFGTVVVLYSAELIGVLKIRRPRIMRTALLVIMCILIIWLVLLIDSIHGDLLGNGIQNFISMCPDFMFPIKLSLLLQIHVNNVVGMIFYELLGIGLFLSIGSTRIVRE